MVVKNNKINIVSVIQGYYQQELMLDQVVWPMNQVYTLIVHQKSVFESVSPVLFVAALASVAAVEELVPYLQGHVIPEPLVVAHKFLVDRFARFAEGDKVVVGDKAVVEADKCFVKVVVAGIVHMVLRSCRKCDP
jgi:hypothetical protein